jgi:hypothetical protein
MISYLHNFYSLDALMTGFANGVVKSVKMTLSLPYL